MYPYPPQMNELPTLPAAMPGHRVEPTQHHRVTLSVGQLTGCHAFGSWWTFSRRMNSCGKNPTDLSKRNGYWSCIMLCSFSQFYFQIPCRRMNLHCVESGSALPAPGPRPLSSTALTVARAARSRTTTASWPSSAAKCNAVWPGALGGTPWKFVKERSVLPCKYEWNAESETLGESCCCSKQKSMFELQELLCSFVVFAVLFCSK